MRKLSLILIFISFLGSCGVNDSEETHPIVCHGDCDSIVKVVHSELKYAYYQMLHGRYIGNFLIIDSGDSTYGNIADYGVIRKTVYNYPKNRSKVLLSYFSDNKEINSEIIHFNEGSINLRASHFLKIENRYDTIFFYPYSKYVQKDSVIVFTDEITYETQKKGDSYYILSSRNINFDKAFLAVLEKRSVRETSYNAFEFKLSFDRVNNSKIFESLYPF